MGKLKFKIKKVRLVLEPNPVLKSIANAFAAPNVADTTRKVLNRSRVLTPVRHGHLRASQTMRMKVGRNYVRGTVKTNLKYALPVHEGQKPHIIRARRVSTLRFVWHGQVVYRKLVHHPGAKGRPFLRTAVIEVGKAAGYKTSGGALGTLITDSGE